MHLDPFIPLVVVALGAVLVFSARRMVRNFEKRYGHDNHRHTPAE